MKTDPDQRDVDRVRAYHDRTKHHVNRYAESLGFLDWANQPDPFRSFAGAIQLPLDHPVLRESPGFDQLFERNHATGPATAAIDFTSLSRLFYYSLALSAWKESTPGNRWSLRVNPSSGALHPTEGYLLCGSVPGVIGAPGLFHYRPYSHSLELRRRWTPERWSELTRSLPSDVLLVGFSSIYWREAWKYGERAFRYCHHDVGHAIGAIAVAARILGWETRLLPPTSTTDLDLLLGTDRQGGCEAEHADCLLAIATAKSGSWPATAVAPLELSASIRTWLQETPCDGEPNRLSREHHDWPVIDDVARACRDNFQFVAADLDPPADDAIVPGQRHGNRTASAERIVFHRRSAVAMDGRTSMPRDVFLDMLQRVSPSGRSFPFAVLPWRPRVSLALFVHRVEDLEPGFYLLVRHPTHRESLRAELHGDFLWQRIENCPAGVELYQLSAADAREAAQAVSCHQEIAADGAFSLGMLAQFDSTFDILGAGGYPPLFWETGLIGQVIYLEA